MGSELLSTEKGRRVPEVGRFGWRPLAPIGLFLWITAQPLSQGAAPQAIAPTVGMVIDRSVRIAPGTYRLPPPDASAPAITVKGENIVVDMTGVTFEGGDPFADPDGYTGIGIAVEGGRGVTIRGGAIRGYKVGILARKSPGLHLTGIDASYNWKARLWSGIEKESLVDWMSYHDNEKDEWLRYGAAIYLSECDDATVDNSRAVQGQNGLMITRSARVKVWNNTFSWLSAIGLGMYRTTDSVVMHNKLDWNVRGYSHGFYYRGQDSAAILMYEQASKNVVAYNSATHGGDGLFLWAGQSTMDTGQGGANDNLFHGNDFSHAVANGIEATFSRNRFIANRIEDCWHGVWGGYSYDTVFIDNTFSGSTDAIAIEHGQNITITGNRFTGDETAIRLWANPTQDPNWGYPKTRDTRSRDYVITQNAFSGHKVALNLLRTAGLEVVNNAYVNVGVPLQTGPEVAALTFELPRALDRRAEVPGPPALAGAVDAMLPVGALRGRATIIVDEWGPYDYRSPKIWPAGKLTDRPLKLRVLGPAGKWTLKSIRGGATDTRSGMVPGELVVVPSGAGLDLDLNLEYVGQDVVMPRGQTFAAGQPVPFSYRQLDPAVAWTVGFWTYEPAISPTTAPVRFAARMRQPPVKSETRARLDFLTSRAIAEGLPSDHVALRAEGQVQLPSGAFDLVAISDDGVRVWVDDRLVIDRWSIHESVVDRAPIAGGRRKVKIEYFEATGWAELQIRFVRR